ncbi:hypothetical protein BGZ98_000378 [Dissophora globulifera]|nr:hypothetical protein BGZ98_000378 [Dissophora globulifera]
MHPALAPAPAPAPTPASVATAAPEAPAAVIPVKRRQPSPPPAKYKKVELTHAATLPRIVWVLDTQGQWWPGKITKYPPEDNIAQVARFGHIDPKDVTVECSESNILPLAQKPASLSTVEPSQKEAFEAAMKEANEAQLHDDDDLPSMDDILSQFTTSTSSSIPTPSSARKGHLDTSKRLSKTDSTYMPDIRFVDYASGHSISIDRRKFFTQYEKGFQTCPLGELALPTIMDNYEDKELEAQVRNLYPVLHSIVAGTHDESGRLRDFLEGGKVRRALAQRVGPGPFNRAEYALISNLLHAEFLPDLATTKKALLSTAQESSLAAGNVPMKREGDITRDFSDQLRLRFVSDVLLPETITRLTMQRRDLGYADAERAVMECAGDDGTDTWWVDDVLAARESFLDGQTTRVFNTMDASARSLLLELMTKSKKGLSLAEQLCSQAREELHACQSHSDEIEKIYSKLCFVSRQIKLQITTIESLLRIGRARLGELSSASNDSGNKATVLFDFLDEASLQRLMTESSERMQRIQSATGRLQELVLFFGDQRTEFKGYLTNAITLDESALSFAREKMHLQEDHTTNMAESLVSLANHYDQVAQVLTADEHLMPEDLHVLESDTAEVLVIISELEESLAIVQATSEEIGVREHLYTTAYQEAVTIFRKVQYLEPELVQLVQLFKTTESLGEDFDATEKLIGEINSLAIWYEEFHNSYGALMVEIVRRHHAHDAQQNIVRDFISRLEDGYIG